MLAFTLGRALQAIAVMFAVGIIAFSMFRFAGDPVSQIVSIDTPPAEREQVRKSLGLDDPVLVQFARYFGNAVQFKFGISYQFRQPVSTLLAERMPATLELATCATAFAILFGILMGRKSNWNGQTRDRDGMAISGAVWLFKWHLLLGAGLTLLAIQAEGWYWDFQRRLDMADPTDFLISLSEGTTPAQPVPYDWAPEGTPRSETPVTPIDNTNFHVPAKNS